MLRTYESQIGIKVAKNIKEEYMAEVFTQNDATVNNSNQQIIDSLKNNYLIPLEDSLYLPNCNITIHIEERVDSFNLASSL